MRVCGMHARTKIRTERLLVQVSSMKTRGSGLIQSADEVREQCHALVGFVRAAWRVLHS